MAFEGVSSIFTLRFGIDQSAAMTKDTPVTVPIDGFAAVDGDAISMPFAGAIVGVSLDTESAPGTGNNLKARPTINGAEISGGAEEGVADKHAYASFTPDKYPVAVGDKIGAEIISDATTGTPTPNETVVTVFVQVGQSWT